MTPKTQQPLHPYSVKIETPTGKSATLPSDWRTKRGSKAHASMCNGSLPMTMRRSSVRRRRACELPCQRRHDRASSDEPETRTAPSNRGRFRFPKTLDESSDFNSGTSQIVAVAKIAV